MQTVLVTFDDEDVTRPVEVRFWKRGPQSREIRSSQQAGEVQRVPDWSRVLPGYVVTPVVGGYHARRRR